MVARADGAVERCASSFRYRIDHGISLAQCGNAWEESALAAGRSRVRALFAGLETDVPLDAQRLLRFACGFRGRLRTSRAQAPVKTAMEKEQRRDVESPRAQSRPGPSGTREKSSYCAPYLWGRWCLSVVPKSFVRGVDATSSASRCYCAKPGGGCEPL